MDHDGGVDDLGALALLAASPEVELAGVCVTPGDSYMESAVPATRALLGLAGLGNVEVGAGVLEGTNPFPDEFRVDGHRVWDLPILREAAGDSAPLAPEPGHEFAARLLLAEAGPIVVVATGPLTTLAAALDHVPEAEERIARLYWMGGAIDVNGNVRRPGHDGSAEWNAYCDPLAAARVWRSGLDILLCPLDATNAVPLSREFISRLGACGHSALAGFAAEAYATTDQSAYHLWDVLTAAWVLHPDLLFGETVPCEVEAEGPSAGRTRREFAGRAVTAALDADGPGLFDFVAGRLCGWQGPGSRT